MKCTECSVYEGGGVRGHTVEYSGGNEGCTPRGIVKEVDGQLMSKYKEMPLEATGVTYKAAGCDDR